MTEARCQRPMWPADTDWSKLTREAVPAWVAQWPLCGAPLNVEQAARAMPYCDQHQAEWRLTRAALGKRGIVVVVTTPEDVPKPKRQLPPDFGVALPCRTYAQSIR